MVFVHHVVDEIIYVDFCAGIDNGFNFVEQLVKFQALGNGDVVERNLTVDAADNGHLVLCLVGHGADAEVFGAFDFKVLAMLLDEFAELRAVALGLACAHSGNILQFLNRLRINGSHRFERGVLENHVGRHVQFLRKTLAQVFEHLEERGVDGARSTVLREAGFFFVEIALLYDGERNRIFHKSTAFVRHAKHAEVFNVLGDIAGNDGLADNGVPSALAFVISNAKYFKFVVMMGANLVGGLAHQNILNIVFAEVLLNGDNHFQYLI